MWTYNYNNELYHYGVPGMKWGVRRAQKRAARADRAIRWINTKKKNNKNTYENMDADTREIYVGKKAKKLNYKLAENKARYDATEVVNDYAIARQKAKKDKTFKKSAEYQNAKKAYSKQYTRQLMFGEAGHTRIEALKSTGMSDKKAKGKVFAEQIMLGAAVGAVSLGATYLLNR